MRAFHLPGVEDGRAAGRFSPIHARRQFPDHTAPANRFEDAMISFPLIRTTEVNLAEALPGPTPNTAPSIAEPTLFVLPVRALYNQPREVRVSLDGRPWDARAWCIDCGGPDGV